MSGSNDHLPQSPTPAQFGSPRKRTSTMSSTTSAVRSAANSVSQVAREALNANPPLGAWAAAADVTSKAPTLGEIRQGTFAEAGWTGDEQREHRRRSSVDSVGRRRSNGRKPSSGGTPGTAAVKGSGEHVRTKGGLEPFPALVEEPTNTSTVFAASERASTGSKTDVITTADNSITQTESSTISEHHRHGHKPPPRVFSSGYIPPPKLPWTTSTMIGLKAFWKWFLTPFGFLITIYCLNVVAWGGMLFLLLCGAAPAMCWVNEGNGWFRDCNHLQSPRRIWLEIDSQILNGLFCVTGFGLIPWRFRDLYYLLRWRLCSEKKFGREQKLYGLRTLAGINANWFRLPGSDTLDELSMVEFVNRTSTSDGTQDSQILSEDPRLPHPLSKIPPAPLTGIRAPPTKLWKLDFFIWCNVWNTFFQACLCGFMWGLNRYDRPSWSTGLFIALACIIAGVGGLVTFNEGKAVKKVEGVQPSPAVLAALVRSGKGREDAEVGHGEVVWEGQRQEKDG